MTMGNKSYIVCFTIDVRDNGIRELFGNSETLYCSVIQSMYFRIDASILITAC